MLLLFGDSQKQSSNATVEVQYAKMAMGKIAKNGNGENGTVNFEPINLTDGRYP